MIRSSVQTNHVCLRGLGLRQEFSSFSKQLEKQDVSERRPARSIGNLGRFAETLKKSREQQEAPKDRLSVAPTNRTWGKQRSWKPKSQPGQFDDAVENKSGQAQESIQRKKASAKDEFADAMPDILEAELKSDSANRDAGQKRPARALKPATDPARRMQQARKTNKERTPSQQRVSPTKQREVLPESGKVKKRRNRSEAEYATPVEAQEYIGPDLGEPQPYQVPFMKSTFFRNNTDLLISDRSIQAQTRRLSAPPGT